MEYNYIILEDSEENSETGVTREKETEEYVYEDTGEEEKDEGDAINSGEDIATREKKHTEGIWEGHIDINIERKDNHSEDCIITPRENVEKNMMDIITTGENTDREQKTYECNACGFCTLLEDEFKEHMSIHAGDNVYRCELCTYSTSTHSEMAMHLKVHEKEKRFKCDFCDYSCERAWSMKIHERVHAGEKPFKCDMCDYKCAQNAHLKTHVRRNHTGDLPYKCGLCDYRTTRAGLLKKHMKVHTGNHRL